LPDRFKTAVGVKEEFKTKSGRTEIQKAINEVFEYLPAKKTLITMYSEKQNYEGKTVQEISEQENRSPAESYADMACEDTAPMAVFFSQDMDVVRDLMPRSYVLTASDGWTVPKGRTKPHPRLYGTFPKKLKQFVIDEKCMDFQLAIRSMTSLPAQKFNIKKRGVLAKGYYADIAILDLNKICDHATYHNPHQYADGIEYLMVNGKLSIEKGKATGDRGGRALKRV
jgi:N-acyl-D-aspartate/D-glutamate deacylase